ncbi:MAG: GntR family transcriptional regulator [Leucobacter sp.]
MTSPASGEDPHSVFSVDPDADAPPYRQLHDAVVAALADGRLVPGQRLPTVRALATQLELAANTVASAYKSLEAAGVVEGRGRAGTFVRLGDDPVDAEARRIALEAAKRLHRLGIDRARAIRYLDEAVAAVGTDS